MNAPFMQLYVADYMADTRHLTCEQDGAYMRLLMAMWRAGGSLPADHAKLARIVGMSASRWAKVRDDVMAFFDEVDGCITSKAIEQWKKKTARTPLSLAVRAAILERDGYQCQYCKTLNGPFEVDHVYPVALGGADDFENLVCACLSCNRSKGSKTLSQWRCAV